MAKDLNSQTLSFVAICQAASIVQRLSRFGSWNEDDAKPLIKALSIDNPTSVEDVYQPKQMLCGYNSFIESFGSNGINNSSTAELTKYVMFFLTLEKKIRKVPGFLDNIFNKIEEVKNHARINKMVILDPWIISSMADIYFQEITNKHFCNLVIYGKKSYLQQDEIQQKIRAIILAGIRATILWRQVGGKTIHLLFKRSKMMELSKNMVRQFK
ncbi:MAG: DUF489 family protein [Succinivibrionaceae bacterium]